MKKRFLFPALLACLLISLGCLAACQGESKNTVAVVDAELVFQESKLASAGMAHLEALTNDMQDRLLKMQEQLGAAPGDKELEAQLQTELFGLQGNMDRAQRAVADRVNNLFDEVVEECRKAQGLQVVLPKQLAMASSPEVDITAKVVALMDARTVSFDDITLVLVPGESAPADADNAENAAPEAD